MSGEANNNPDIFSNLEIDTIGEIMNISMGSAATAASTLLDHKVVITTPVVSVVPLAEFYINTLEPATGVEIKYVEGISGSNILILRQQDVRTILAQMMQMEIDEEYVLDEIGESAMCELMNQMMGSSATVLSCFLGRSINISTPTLLPVGEFDDFKREHFPQRENILTIKFAINIKDIMESEFVSVMDIDLAKEIIAVSLDFDSEQNDVSPLAPPATRPAASPAAPPMAMDQAMPAMPQQPAPPMDQGYAQQPYQQPQQPYPQPQQQYQQQSQYAPYPQQQYQQQPQYAPPPYPYPPQGYGYAAPQAPQAAESPIVVKDYDYADFTSGKAVPQDMPANIDLVMDVPVVVTVELGRTKRKIKEILEFGQGTIVELDKQAGSQVDVIVNGQLIARGDVVVVDDNFSIRITEILKTRDSLTML